MWSTLAAVWKRLNGGGTHKQAEQSAFSGPPAAVPDRFRHWSRSDLRYQLYRIALTGEDANTIAPWFEMQPGFGGWNRFAVTWDVGREDPWAVVARSSERRG